MGKHMKGRRKGVPPGLLGSGAAVFGLAGLLALTSAGIASATTEYATVTGHAAFSAAANTVEYWCGTDGGTKVEDPGGSSFVLPAGVYAKVIVKAGVGPFANTIFAAPPTAGQTVWADTNGDGTYNPGGQHGDKTISHVIMCNGPTPTTTTTATEPPTSSTTTATEPPTLQISCIDAVGDMKYGYQGAPTGAQMVIVPPSGPEVDIPLTGTSGTDLVEHNVAVGSHVSMQDANFVLLTQVYEAKACTITPTSSTTTTATATEPPPTSSTTTTPPTSTTSTTSTAIVPQTSSTTPVITKTGAVQGNGATVALVQPTAAVALRYVGGVLMLASVLLLAGMATEYRRRFVSGKYKN